jgi:hypothetical protein
MPRRSHRGFARPALAAIRAAVTLFVLLGAARADAELLLPVEARAGSVIVRAEHGLDRLAASVAASAPGALARIHEDLRDLPRPAQVEIRLVKVSDELGRVAPPGYRVPPWAAGVAFPREGVVAVATRRGADSIDVERVVAHELAHLALGAALGNRAPRWLDEGFAFLHSADFSASRTRELTGMAWTGRVIPLGALDHHFPKGEQEASRAYAQSYDFVAYLAMRGHFPGLDGEPDPWPFRYFLAGIASGHSLNEAAIAAYGAPLSALFDEWYESLRDRYFFAPAGLVGLGVWALAAVLLVIGYVRRRRQNRERLRRWEEEEAAWPAEVMRPGG